ncbi:MAG TPA: T9SS type A sorting domain-containing protein [Chitinophagales bacterium]|nr:T9SS type A sorting domain-containing protein [Chitinophagales bacterium]
MQKKLLFLVSILLFSLQQEISAQTCPAPFKVFTECNANNAGAVHITIMEQVGTALAPQYRITRTNLATGQAMSSIAQTGGTTGSIFNTTLDGLEPATDYLIRVRRICSTNPLVESPPVAALSSCPDSYAAIVNLERKATGVTAIKELGPLYICNLDTVKSVKVDIKNDSTGVLEVSGYSLLPGQCICWGNPKTLYKISITSGTSPNFKITAPRTRIDCSTSTNKTEENEVILDREEEYALYPNPTQGQVALEYNSSDNEYVSVQLYGADGRLIDQPLSPTKHEAGRWLLRWSVEELPNGIYYCHITNNQGTKVLKLAKFNY